jgi:hypothetical protein
MEESVYFIRFNGKHEAGEKFDVRDAYDGSGTLFLQKIKIKMVGEGFQGIGDAAV